MNASDINKFLVDAQKLYINHQESSNADDFKKLQKDIDTLLGQYGNDGFTQNVLSRINDEIHRRNRIRVQLPMDIEQIRKMTVIELKSYDLEKKTAEYLGDSSVRQILELTIKQELSQRLSPNIFRDVAKFLDKFKETTCEDEFWESLMDTSRKMTDYYQKSTFSAGIICDSVLYLQDNHNQKQMKDTA